MRYHKQENTFDESNQMEELTEKMSLIFAANRYVTNIKKRNKKLIDKLTSDYIKKMR